VTSGDPDAIWSGDGSLCSGRDDAAFSAESSRQPDDGRHGRLTGVAAVHDVPWLIFDGDCAFCTSSAHWLARRLRRLRGPNARLVAWQFTDLAALGTTAERTRREALWVSTDGTLYGGAAAFAAWLKFRGGAYAIVGRAIDLPVIRALAAAVYRVIAKNRHRMPGGSPACALPPPGFDPAQPGTKAL
jgi:predicted DCC family thiol-disulfide oxidoreductase YuxK